MKTVADDILLLIKTRGPATTLSVAGRLGVSRQAARVRLEKLAEQGLVKPLAARGSVGRPKVQWSLTEAGHLRFPDTHAQMTVELIEAVREEFGEPGLERLLARREQATAAGYAQALGPDPDLETRLSRLVKLRGQEGYMAAWTRDGAGYLLVENHCPICAAAATCQGFCRSELAMFESLLAPAKVERLEHILAGARRCAYRITPTLSG